jgi:hypothetical protein
MKKQEKNDFHIQVLKCMDDRPEGFTLSDLELSLKNLTSEQKYFLHQTLQLQNSVAFGVGTTPESMTKYIMSFEGKFMLLEYTELKEARQASQEAMDASTIAIKYARLALIVSIITGIVSIITGIASIITTGSPEFFKAVVSVLP